MSEPVRTLKEPAPASEAPDVIHLPDRRRHGRKKVTSGSENRRRTAAVRVRLHPADAERLKLEAAEAGMSVAGYLASGRLGEEAAPRPRRHRRPMPVDEIALLKGLAAFNRENSNLNQLTHTGNLLMLMAEERSDAELLAAARELVRGVDLLREQSEEPLAMIRAALRHERQG